jgi:hypothetical protein
MDESSKKRGAKAQPGRLLRRVTTEVFLCEPEEAAPQPPKAPEALAEAPQPPEQGLADCQCLSKTTVEEVCEDE